jgi:hypothetical protein
MRNADDNKGDSRPKAAAAPASRNRTWAISVVSALFVVAAFLSWHSTWFGRSLSNADLDDYLRQSDKPRHIQHALWQVGEQIVAGDAKAKRWYPQVVSLANSPVTEVRQMAAFVMGQDNRSEEFHGALRGLLNDEQPIVRRNAALSLVRFGDISGHDEIRAILQPSPVKSSSDGIVESLLGVGSEVRLNSLIARVKADSGAVTEVRANVPGRISTLLASEGTRVSAKEELALVSSDAESAWEALRAFYLIGRSEDLAMVRTFASGQNGMPQRVVEQADRTIAAIEERNGRKRDVP